MFYFSANMSDAIYTGGWSVHIMNEKFYSCHLQPFQFNFFLNDDCILKRLVQCLIAPLLDLDPFYPFQKIIKVSETVTPRTETGNQVVFLCKFQVYKGISCF